MQMKRLLALLMCLFLLPLCAVAEEAQDVPPGYRLVDFEDFTMPIAPNAIVRHYDKTAEDGVAAEILYLDLNSEHFSPYIIVWWVPNNMTEHTKHAHPLEYAKSLRDNVISGWRGEGMIVSSTKDVFGQKRGNMLTCTISCRIEENSWFADEAHDLWMVQRQYGTYAMGTYYLEIYAECREAADALLEDIDRVVYKK